MILLSLGEERGQRVMVTYALWHFYKPIVISLNYSNRRYGEYISIHPITNSISKQTNTNCSHVLFSVRSKMDHYVQKQIGWFCVQYIDISNAFAHNYFVSITNRIERKISSKILNIYRKSSYIFEPSVFNQVDICRYQ